MTIDYTRNEIDVLIDLIRTDNDRKTLTTGQVTFGNPNQFTPVQGVNRNTLIIATSIPGRGYEGSQSFYYNRVPLIDFVPANDPGKLYFDYSGKAKLSELLPELNSRLIIKLTPEVIVEQSLPQFPPGDDREYVDVVLMVKPNSMVYLGQVTVRVLRPVNDDSLETAIYNAVLEGFDYADS